MDLIINIFILILGLLGLLKGADWFIDAAVDLSRKFNLNPKLVGLTLIAVGTSLPEITLTIVAATQNSTGLVIGNVFGSNVFNILAVAGISALLGRVYLEKNFFKKEAITLILVNLLVIIWALFVGYFNFWTAIFLFGAAGVYFWNILSDKKINKEVKSQISHTKSPLYNLLIIILGTGLLAFGSRLVIDSATRIAQIFSLSESIVGIGILAVGTGLPELVTSFNASKKGHHELSFGNILGSNVVNLTIVLGIGASFSKLILNSTYILEMGFTLLSTLLFFGILLSPKKYELKFAQGLMLILAYIIYLAAVVGMTAKIL